MTSNHRALDDSDIALIEQVKLTPSLYDQRNRDFRLAYRKEQDWDVVATQLGMAAAEARRRWTCLRDRYSRELKQLRLHPEKGDFGNNTFFRQMDFLRSFVRKRRARRKYDSSWDGSMSEGKIHTKISAESEGMDDDLEESTENYEKLEMVEAEAEEYPEYVEVDSNEAYSEYVEHQTTSNSSYASKPMATTTLSNTPVPIMLHQQSLNGTTIYALTSSEVNTTTQIAEKQLNELKVQPLTAPLASSSPATTTASSVTAVAEPQLENEDDFFCKSIGGYLRQLSRRYKIKAKVEMFQILEKYIELEENSNAAAQRERKS